MAGSQSLVSVEDTAVFLGRPLQSGSRPFQARLAECMRGTRNSAVGKVSVDIAVM